MRSERLNGWSDVRLGAHIDLLVGFAFKSAEFSDQKDDIRLLRGDNVGQGRLRWNGARKWPADRTSEFERYMIRSGDVVLAMDRPWIDAGLKYAVVRDEDVPCLLVQRVARLRGSATLCQRYLGLVIGSPAFTTYVRAVQTGTAVPHISGGQIADFCFWMPPRDEQGRIASVLGALDEKIDSNRRLAGLLEETVATLFRARFVDFVGVDEFEDRKIGRVPRGWRVGSLYDLASVTYGRPFRSSLFNDSEGTPLIRIRDLPGNEPSVLTPESRTDARLIRRGDIVVGMDGEFRAHVWAGPDSWLNQRVCAVDPRDAISRAFVFESIKRPLAFFEATKGGTTVIHLGKRDIDTFAMVVPPPMVLREFGIAADSLLAHAVELRWESRTLASCRDALLPKLISGQVRLPNTGDPAEVIEPAAEALAASS